MVRAVKVLNRGFCGLWDLMNLKSSSEKKSRRDDRNHIPGFQPGDRNAKENNFLPASFLSRDTQAKIGLYNHLIKFWTNGPCMHSERSVRNEGVIDRRITIHG